jgi:hypothetical protein
MNRKCAIAPLSPAEGLRLKDPSELEVYVERLSKSIQIRAAALGMSKIGGAFQGDRLNYHSNNLNP